MRQYYLGFLVCLVCFSTNIYAQTLELIPFAENLRRPVDIAHASDDRLFVVEKDGTIVILRPDGKVDNIPFLDIRTRVNAFANERGLLGLAFHPDYTQNGFFYVHYTNNQGNSVISRFTRDSNNPDRALPDSEVILMTVNQPFNNHNAGDLNFGPDGFLYIGMGDGGSGGDPGNRSQNPRDLLGKMLRVDVNGDAPYTIPDTNPFKGNADTLQEIWSLGWRNPWRFSFDRLTGDMWIADVGQNAWEEINMEPPGQGGLNYGWRCYEGNNTFNTTGCRLRENYTFPVHVYPNRFDVGCSVTGGYVYRGSKFPKLYGKYIYTDFCTGIFWMLERSGNNWINTQLGDFDNQDFATFGEDSSGELYVAGLASGRIYKITDSSCNAFYSRSIDVNVQSTSCPDSCDGRILITGDISGLSVLWEDNDSSFAKINLCPGDFRFTLQDSSGCNAEFIREITAPELDSLMLFINGDSLQAEGNIMSEYQWYLNGQLMQTTDIPVIVPQSGGSYFVVAISFQGCIIYSDTLIFIPSGTINPDRPRNIYLLENPLVHKTLRWVQPAGFKGLAAKIYNLEGKVLYQRYLNADTGDVETINLDALRSGTYILSVNGLAVKFIIQ